MLHLVTPIALLLTIIGVAHASAPPEETAKGAPDSGRPNIVIALSDQHRWHSMSFTETPAVHTPEMARLAEEGFSANNFVSNYAVCSPARAMLLTGRWPLENGVIDNSTKNYAKLDASHPTYAKAFSNAGYDTGYVGKWHLGGEVKTLEAFGFRHSIVWNKTNEHWDSRYYDAKGNRHTSKRYNGAHMTDQLLEFISQDRDGPFLAVVSWNLPHSNYMDAPPALRLLYPNEQALPRRENWSFPPELIGEIGGTQYRGYHAHVTAIDVELGRIRTHLRSLGIERDTILIYLSDHGGMMRSHGLFGKRVPYAESVRVPFLAVWPGSIAAGGSSDAPLGTIDFLPTLCGLAGVSAPTGSRGMDVSKLVLGQGGPEPRAQLLMNIVAEHPRKLSEPSPPVAIYRGLVTRDHTYAVTASEPWLLFDNRADPFQKKNLASDPASQTLKRRLHGELAELLLRSGDDFALPTLEAEGP